MRLTPANRLRCDLYKRSLPERGPDPEAGAQACARIGEAAAAAWVVLSSGVAGELFEGRLEVACREGASGLLAGRSVFGDAIAGTGAGRREPLRTVARPRLERHGAVAERLARPRRVRRAANLSAAQTPHTPDRYVPEPELAGQAHR